jgi:hypothetical protein
MANSEEIIFSTDEYAVKSFQKNALGYLLIFQSIEDSVPEGAIIHIMVGNSGEGTDYRTGVLQYQFSDLYISEMGKFDIQFGIGIPSGNQLKIRSKRLFRNMTKEKIEKDFSIYPLIDSSGQPVHLPDVRENLLNFTVSENVVIPDDKSYAGSVPVKSGTYFNSRNRMILKDDVMGEDYRGDGTLYKVKFAVDYDNNTWTLHIDSNGNGDYEDSEWIQGNTISISDLKIIYYIDASPVAYMVHYDMGFELYAYLGGKSYLMFLEYSED